MDLSPQLEKLQNGIGSKRKEKNNREVVLPFEAAGYGIAWNPHKVGELLVGDNSGKVTLLSSNSKYSEWSRTS